MNIIKKIISMFQSKDKKLVEIYTPKYTFRYKYKTFIRQLRHAIPYSKEYIWIYKYTYNYKTIKKKMRVLGFKENSQKLTNSSLLVLRKWEIYLQEIIITADVLTFPYTSRTLSSFITFHIEGKKMNTFSTFKIHLDKLFIYENIEEILLEYLV